MRCRLLIHSRPQCVCAFKCQELRKYRFSGGFRYAKQWETHRSTFIPTRPRVTLRFLLIPRFVRWILNTSQLLYCLRVAYTRISQPDNFDSWNSAKRRRGQVPKRMWWKNVVATFCWLNYDVDEKYYQSNLFSGFPFLGLKSFATAQFP